jgi:YVTN family beta-propeller protein
MKKSQLFYNPDAKSFLRLSILTLVAVLSTVSTGLAQESVSSELRTAAGLPSNQIVATIPLGLNVFASALVVSPDSKTIYVASFTTTGGLVTIIDSQSNTVTDTIPVAGSADFLAITPDGSNLYVGNTGGLNVPTSVYVISTASRTVTATIQLSAPDSLAMSPSGKEVYITDPDHKAVSIIETATNTLIPDAIRIGGVSEQIAVAPNGKSAYVSTGSNFVAAVNLATNKVIAKIPLPPSNDLPLFLAFSPDSRKIYLNRRKRVLVIDTSSNTITRRILMPITQGGRNNAAGQTAITPDGQFLYVPYAVGNTVAMLNTVTNQAAGNQISINYPEAVAVAPTQPFAYTLGAMPGNGVEYAVYVINISPE